VSRHTYGTWRRTCRVQTAFVATLLLAGSVESAEPNRGDAASDSHTVTIAGMQFEPAALVVKRGSRIVWINKDLFPHTVAAVDNTFDSASIAAGSSWTYAPTKPGTHAYVCGLHPTMKGRLIVR
jgi:plastocyanin